MAMGKMKCSKVYEDKKCIAFKDIHPVAPIHYLIISKVFHKGHVHELKDDNAADLGHLFIVAGKIAKKEKLLDGYRLVINQGKDALQSINYLHLHMISGKKMKWPPC